MLRSVQRGKVCGRTIGFFLVASRTNNRLGRYRPIPLEFDLCEESEDR
jgi:hypothetical protein